MPKEEEEPADTPSDRAIVAIGTMADYHGLDDGENYIMILPEGEQRLVGGEDPAYTVENVDGGGGGGSTFTNKKGVTFKREVSEGEHPRRVL